MLVPPRITAVAAGACHSLLVTVDGTLYTCGSGIMGQLGHGTTQHAELTPRRVEWFVANALRIVQAAGGSYHSLAVDDNGRCYSWGAGEARERTSTWPGGWLGHRSLESELLPRPLAVLLDVRVVQVAASSFHSMALAADGSVFSWGDGGGGKLGHEDDEIMQWAPKRIDALKGMRVAAISAGELHSLCVLRDGRVLGWGAGRAIGLGGDVMSHRDDTPASWGSAGNYEWTPGDVLRCWQAHTPTEVRL